VPTTDGAAVLLGEDSPRIHAENPASRRLAAAEATFWGNAYECADLTFVVCCRLLRRPRPAARVAGLAHLLWDLALAEEIHVTARLLPPENALAIYRTRPS
jgi:hypothetical protein